MDRALFYKKIQEEIDSLHQEDFNNPSVWFGIGVGAACAVKAFEEATRDEESDPNKVKAEITGNIAQDH